MYISVSIYLATSYSGPYVGVPLDSTSEAEKWSLLGERTTSRRIDEFDVFWSQNELMKHGLPLCTTYTQSSFTSSCLCMSDFKTHRRHRDLTPQDRYMHGEVRVYYMHGEVRVCTYMHGEVRCVLQ